MCCDCCRLHLFFSAAVWTMQPLCVLLFVLLAAAPPRAGSNAVGALAGAADRPRFRALSPRDSDSDVVGKTARGVVLGSDPGKVRNDVAARFGVDFGPRPQKIVLQLRPDEPGEGDLDASTWAPAVDEDTVEDAAENASGENERVDFSFVESLTGSLDELCERFLRNAAVRTVPDIAACVPVCVLKSRPYLTRPTPWQIKVLTEEEYAERKLAANCTRGAPARYSFPPTTLESHGNKATVRVIEQPEAPPSSQFFITDHVLDGVNASVLAAVQKTLKSLPPTSASSYPRPGDYLKPGPFGLERDWNVEQEPGPQNFEVIEGKEGGGGKTEVWFETGGHWDQVRHTQTYTFRHARVRVHTHMNLHACISG